MVTSQQFLTPDSGRDKRSKSQKLKDRKREELIGRSQDANWVGKKRDQVRASLILSHVNN